MIYPMVEVTWHDAFSRAGGWTTLRELIAEADTPIEVRSVGHLVHRSPRHIILAISTNDSLARAADTMTIPRGCVRRIRRLTAGRRVK